MTNVFLINSYLTYLVARLVLEKEGYSRDQSIFVFFRGIRPLDPTRYVAYDFKSLVVDINMPHFPTYLKFYKGQRLKADLFRQIRSVTQGKEFKLHTFQTNARVVQLVRSMPECVGTDVLEEGSCVYELGSDELDRLYRRPIRKKEKFWNLLNYGTSIKEPGFAEKGLHCYCLFDDAFRGAEKKTPLFDLPKILDVFKPRPVIEAGSAIFVHTYFDPPSPILLDVYLALVTQMSKQYSGRPLYHRFHPSQDSRSREVISMRLAKNGLETKELPGSEPIESYVFSPQPFTFIGWDSSVFHYARRMGKEVVVAGHG